MVVVVVGPSIGAGRREERGLIEGGKKEGMEVMEVMEVMKVIVNGASFDL